MPTILISLVMSLVISLATLNLLSEGFYIVANLTLRIYLILNRMLYLMYSVHGLY
jgi:hypothetical protein